MSIKIIKKDKLAPVAPVVPAAVATGGAAIPSEHVPAKAAPRRRERKSQRMDIRVTPTVKEFVEHIMDVTGLTAGDLLLEGAKVLLRDLEARPPIDRPDYSALRFRRPS